MLVPTHLRRDRTLPVITVGLDGVNTHVRKKFKCSICGGTVFIYKDTLHFLLPVDASEGDEDSYTAVDEALTEVECNHYYMDTESGKRTRCRTIYVLMRGRNGQ